MTPVLLHVRLRDSAFGVQKRKEVRREIISPAMQNIKLRKCPALGRYVIPERAAVQLFHVIPDSSQRIPVRHENVLPHFLVLDLAAESLLDDGLPGGCLLTVGVNENRVRRDQA